MLQGVYLTLLVGPVVPVPAPRSVIDALTSLQVNSNTDGPSGFQMSFVLTNDSPLNTLFLLASGGLPPVIRVVIVATVNGTPQVLMDGVITRTDVQPGTTSGQSTLTVTGEDLTRLMDYIDFSGLPYPAMPPEARVAAILAKYLAFGIVPVVIPSPLTDVSIPTERFFRQKGKDLAYIKQLASEAGYVFFVDPGPAPGTSVAYWGPEFRIGIPQPAINLNMDAATNCESLSMHFDSEKGVQPVLFVENELTDTPIPIPVPDISLLSPPLGLIPPLKKNVELMSETANLSPIEAATRALAMSSRSDEAVTGSGTLDVQRYGQPLKARGLVGVRGIGMAFDGLYFVKSVTHHIKRGSYKQDFTLTRNGLVSTVPVVPA